MDFLSTLSSTASELYNSLEPSISSGIQSLSESASNAYTTLSPSISEGLGAAQNAVSSGLSGISNLYETSLNYANDVARLNQLESEASQGMARFSRGDFGGALSSLGASLKTPFARKGVSSGAETLALTTTPYIQAARGVSDLVKVYGESGLQEHFARKKQEKERIKEATQDVEFDFARLRRKKTREHEATLKAMKEADASKEQLSDEKESQKEEWVLFEREYKKAKRKASEGEKTDFDIVRKLFGDEDIDQIQVKIQRKLQSIKGAREQDKGKVDEIYETGFNVLKDVATNEMKHQLGKLGNVNDGVRGFGSSLTKKVWDKRMEMLKPVAPKTEVVMPEIVFEKAEGNALKP